VIRKDAHSTAILQHIDAAYLFIDEEKVPGPMVEVLARSGIQIRKYEDVLDSLQEQQKVEGKIWVDGNSANVAIYKYATAQMLK